MDFLFPAGRKLEPGWYAGLAGYDEFAAVRIGLQTEKHTRVMGLPASSGSEAVRRGAAKGRRIAGSDPSDHDSVNSAKARAGRVTAYASAYLPRSLPRAAPPSPACPRGGCGRPD